MRPSRATIALGVLVTLSGMCGLVYEVIWVRHLSLIVGATTLAVSLVVAGFLAGLVVGSLALGPWVDRVRRPLRAYALLELCTGVSALMVTFALDRLPEWMGRVGLPGGGPLPLRVVLVFVLVLAPTFAMGGTLPALVRFATKDLASVGRSFGWLYSLNTLGAAIGCGVSGFFLIGSLGLTGTAMVAAATNLLVAVIAFVLDAQASSSPAPQPQAPVAAPARAMNWLFVAFALSGFASIAYEVLWFRVLSTTLESSVYAFTLLLVTFLFGLVLGGVFYAARLSNHPRPLELLVGIQSLVALAALFSLAMLGQVRTLEHALPGGYVWMFVRAGLIILVPTTLIGMAFPLVAQLTTVQLERLGRNVGVLYSVNTVGGIAGSLLVGLLLIPVLGTQRTFLVVCALSMGVALMIQRLDPAADSRARVRLGAIAGLLGIGLVLLPRNYLVHGAWQFDDSKLLDVREGADGTLAVVQYDNATICGSNLYACGPQCAAPFEHRQLLFGSVSYASTVMPARRYMRTLAHLPMLMHPAPKDVLEVCFGTGTTAAAFVRHPELKSLTVVDLNRDVLALAPYFRDSNFDVLADPRVRAVVDDGRHQLRSSDARYDVISFEPPPPRSAGAVNLYSREFYQLVKARLRPGGMMSQWIPLDQQSDVLAKMLIRSMLDVFKEVQLWIPARAEAVLIASDAPLTIDAARWTQRWANPAVKANLADVGYDTPESMLGSFLLGTEALRKYVGDLPAVTDDRPAIEYFLSDSSPPYSIDGLLVAAQTAGAVMGPLSDPAMAEKIGDHAEAHRKLLRAHALGQGGEPGLAAEQVDLAFEKSGDGRYSEYLKSLEYGCLVRQR
jgi:spermidine synthase